MFNAELKRVGIHEGSKEYEGFTKEMESARTEFINAAREELGYPPD